MTLRWIEGFERLQDETIAARLYTPVSGTFNHGSIEGPRGGLCADSSTLVMRTPALVGSVANTWVTGIAMRVTAGQLDSAPSARPYVSYRNSAGEQLKFEIIDAPDTTKPGGAYFKIRVMRGAVELARTVERFSGLASDLEWVYYEMKATIRTGTNGSFSLKFTKRKGTTQTATWDAANTGVNTANQGSDGADRVEYAWATGSGADRMGYDDSYILDSAGSVNNDFLGPVYVEGINPLADGNSTDWSLAGGATNLEDAWNEPVGSQSTGEDDKRATSDTVGEQSLVTMSNLVDITNTTVIGVQVRAFGKMETTGSRTVEIRYRKTTGGAAETGGGTKVFNTTTLVGFADTQELDPNTGAAWTETNINGEELGVKLTA